MMILCLCGALNIASDMFPFLISHITTDKITSPSLCLSTLCRMLFDIRRGACLAPLLPIVALRATRPRFPSSGLSQA
jgi:hypothetical protein